MAATTAVTFSAPGVAWASPTLDSMTLPLLVVDSGGVTGRDVQDANATMPVLIGTDTRAVMMTSDMSSFIAGATSIVKVLADGRLDESFAVTGRLDGLSDIVAIAIDEQHDRVYVLDAGGNSTTLIAVSLDGEVLATADVAGAMTLVAGASVVVVFGATVGDGTVWSSDLTASTPLNLDVDVDPSIAVGRVTAVPPARLDDTASTVPFVVADPVNGILRRVEVVNPTGPVPTLTLVAGSDAIPMTDVTALAAMAAGTVFVARSSTGTHEVVQVSAEDELVDGGSLALVQPATALAVAPVSSDADVAAPEAESPMASSRSMSVSNVPCTPTTLTTGRYTLHKFMNTDAACDYTTLPDSVTAIDVLAVGGGGGGGAGQSSGTSTGGGGGGAAQLVTNIAATPSSTWQVEVGAGGIQGGGSCCGGNEQSGTAGGSTTFGDIVVQGGQGSLRQGLGGTAGAGGSANVGGVAGGSGGAPNRGAGGAGTYFTITGSSVCYGAGGGGGASSGVGGAGGCGVAASSGQSSRGAAGGNALADGITAQNAADSLHFGGDIYRGHGGGGAAGSGSGGTGGPGVVYVRYATIPTITGPVATTVEATKNATFSVTATAGTATTNQLAYQWRKDGVDIAGATSSTLTVTAAEMDDVGQYDVIVTNDDGNGKTSSATSSAATLTVEPRSFNFKIASLTVSTTDRTAMEVNSYTGDDRGGMAISSSRAFLLGDTALASFDKNVTSGTLGTTTNLSWYTEADSIVSDVKAQKAYVFNRGNTTGCGAVASPCFTRLIELNASTGAMTGTSISLSQPIPQGSSGEYYAGYGRVVYRNGATSVVYDVDLPSGDVTVAGTRSISRQVSENNSHAWGVAEYFDGDLWLVHSGSSLIRRTNVRTGTTETIVACNCSDLASFVVDPSVNRWYFHWEGFASSFNFGSNETFGYASATFETLPSASITPAASSVTGTSTTFSVQFQEGVTGIAADDFSLSGTSTGWSIASVTAQSATQYTVTVNQSSGTEGTLILSLRSGAGSWTGGGGVAIPSSTVSSSTVTVDQTVPTASFSTVPTGPLSSASSTYTVTFSETITGLAAGDFSNAGTATGCTIVPAGSSGITINVAVSGCGDGTLELRLAADAVSDAVGNTGPAAAVTAASRYVDGTPGAPVLSFSHSNGSITNASTLTYALTANEPVSGLTASDISNVGTAQNCQIAVSGTQPGTSFTVTVTGCDEGTVILRLASGEVVDNAGNAGPAVVGSPNTLDRSLSVGGSPMYSAVHPDGTKLYVTDSSSSVKVYNTSTGALIATITVGNMPRGVDVTPDGNFVYVANRNSNTVSKISTATNTVVGTISVGSVPNGLAITPAGDKVIVGNYSGSSLSVIATATDTVSATINLGRGPWNVKVSPDGTMAYTGNVGHASVSVVNLSTNAVVTHVGVGTSPHEVGVNRAGTRVYAANYSSNSISVIDTATNTVIHTVSGISLPMGIVTSLDDSTVYVNEYSNFRVRMFDASTYAVSGTVIATGNYPWGMTMSADGSKGFVGNYSGGSVTIFNAAGGVQSTSVTVDQAVPTASFSTVPAGPLSSASSTYTVTFSEAVSGLTAGDFANAGTATGCAIAPAGSSGITIDVTVSGCGEGSLDLRLAANSVSDVAGNVGPASAVTAASRYVDGTPGAPVLSFSHSNGSVTNASTLTYTLTANEPVSGLTDSDISNVGTAQNCQISVSGTQPGTTFTVTVTDCDTGTVALRLAADSVTDAAGLTAPSAGSGTPNTVFGTVPSMGGTLYAAAHPDGNRLYVSDGSSTVRVVNASTLVQTASIAVGSSPYGIDATPDGAFVYVANYSSNTVSKISTATNTVVATISVQSNPVGVRVVPDGSRVLVTNYSSSSMSFINVSTNAVTHLALGFAPWNLDVAPDGSRAYVGLVNNGRIGVVDLTTNTVVTNSLGVGTSPYELMVNRAGTRLYVANYSSNTVSVINTATNTIVATISGFSGPMGMVASLDDSTVYVADYLSARLRRIDTVTNAMQAGTISTGSNPRGMTISPDGTIGYVSNAGSGTVTAFRAAGAVVQSTFVTFDQSVPTATFSTVPAGPLTPSATTFTLTFSEAISGLTAGDFTNAGTATGCTIAPAASSGTTINVTVSGCGDGTLELQLVADAVTDVAGNTGPASAVTAASRFVDAYPGAPVLTFSQSPSSPSSAATLEFTLTSNERISGLDASDIVNIGTATDCTIAVAGTQPGTSFQVSVTDCSEGTVQLRLTNGSVADGAGTTGPASGGTANTLVTNISGMSTNMYSAVHPDGSKYYIAAQGLSQVRVMNTATNAFIAAVSVGSNPRGIAVTPDGNFVYVANYSSNTVSKISTSTNTVVRTINVGSRPVGLEITPDGTKVVVANYSSNSLSVISTATDTVSSTISMGRRGWNLKLSPDGRTAYVGNVSNASVTVVNLTTNAVTAYVAVGSSPHEVGINRSGTRVYAANYSSNTVSVINTATNTVIRTVSGFSSPMGIATSVDDRTVYVVNYGSQRVRWFDADTYALNAGQIVVGSAAWGLSMTPDGSRGYVSNYSSQTLSVFAAEGFVQSAQISYDRLAPTVSSFASNTNSPNDLTDQSWTLQFSEPVTGLDAADFTVGGTSTGWSTPVVTGSGSSYTVSVSHANPGEGTVSLSLRDAAVTDVAGNTGPASVTSGTTVTWRVGQGVFKIESLTTNNVTAKEVAAQTGDDRGGIALTADRALLSGDSGLGRFDLSDLNNGVRAVSQNATWMDGIVTDIKTLKSYAFNLNSSRNGNLTTLTQLDPSTGLLSSTVVTLSSPIPVSSRSVIFAGYSRVAIWTGGILYDISLPSGQVTNYGSFSMPSRQTSENWAEWGVIEYFGGQLHLVYNSNGTTISRVNVATGTTSTVFSNSNGFSDMASFVVNPRSNRWYFHYEGRAGAFNFGSDETIGFADATFNVGGEQPDPVTNLSVSTRSSTAVVTWDAPAAGPTPTDYVLQYSLDSGSTWRWVNDGTSTDTTASIPGFTPGANVRFRVASVSGVNSSGFVASEDSMVSPYATAPTITLVTTANGALNVAFTAPSSPGASAITTYQYSLDAGTTWTNRAAGTTGSPLTISGLTNGTEYSVMIRAVNTQGGGEASASMVGTPTTTPDAPAITDISPTASGTLTVMFTAPAGDGGTAITNYQYSVNNGSTWVTRNPASTASPIVIGGLTNGLSYNVRLRAVNARGTGTVSAAVLGTAGVVANAPTISSVSSGDGTINVVFSAPSYNGGLTITNYEYSIDGGSTWTVRSPSSVSSPLQIDGLTNGTSYTVAMRAVNAAGSGTTSSTRIAAPSRTPDAPTIGTIEPSSQRLRVIVTAPAFDGGVAITNYQYSTNDGATWTSLSPVNTSGTFSITGLNNAQEYQVRVRAVNARGSGAPSAAVAATPATTPGAPVISAITPSSQTLNVAFTAGATGGAAPTNYEYSLDDGSTWTAMSPATTVSPLTITGLTNGTSYAVRIRAVNAQGAGASSGATDGVPATTPSAPTIDAITGSDSRLSVAVTNGFDGGATITNYEYSTDGGSTWTTRMPASAQSPVVIGGLTNALDYNVRIRAVNSQGAGAQSAVSVGRPVTAPDAPTISSIAGSPGTLTVTFTTPAFDGGATITNYEYSTDGGSTWTTRSPASTSSPLTVTGLTDGTTYPVRIRALNSEGGGTSSAMVEGVPENAPGAPVITSVVSGNQSVRVAFTAASPRGLTVTTYQYSTDDGATWTPRSPDSVSSPLTIEGLVNGTTYRIKIRGVNARGAGLPSDAVDGIPSTPPGAPTITSVTAGAASGSLEVAFTDGSTGGSAITETQYSLDGGTSWSAGDQTTSPVTITGLTNGATYGVKLRHVNLRGAGVASASVNGVPLSTPGAPTLSSVRGSDGTITAYVVPPAVTGGTPVTNYEYFVEYGNAGAWVAVSPVSTSMPITITQFARYDDSDPDDPNPPLITAALVNGNNYQVKVRAVNARGAGEESQALSVKPSTVPGAPTISSITAQDSQLTVAFTAPASDGGEAIRNYEYSLDNGSTWAARAPLSADSPLVIGGLTNGTDYDVKIRALNVQGEGAASNMVTARPAGAADAPTIAAVTSGDTTLSVFFAQGSDNGAATTNVEYSIDGSTWVARSPASTASPLVIGGLTNGTAYPVRIRMVNGQGSGASSSATSATPARVPDAPTIDGIAPQDGALSVTLTAGSNGGAAVTTWEYSTDGGTTWASSNSASSTLTIPQLVNGTSYAVAVRAVNRIGAGAATASVNATPSTTPDAPVIASVSSGSGRVTVAFSEAFNGGAATTNVAYSLDGGSTWSLRSPAAWTSPMVIAGLTNGTSYNLRLAMVNSNGRGTASGVQLIRPATTPDAPVISSIASDNRALTVSVTAPADDGGDDIVNYEYSLDAGASWNPESSVVSDGSFSITGLTNGTTYAVLVRAVNGFGAGESSAAVQGTPSTVPTMPVIVSTTPGDREIELAFQLGPNGGSTITNIQFSIDDGTTWTTRSPASVSSPLTITGLQNGVTYPIRVRAVNAKGSGIASRTSGTPATAPGAPVVTRVSPLDSGLRVEFEPPADNGGALITNYAYRIGGGAWTALSPASDASPFDVAGLTNGTSYSVEIAAINSQSVLSGAGANAVASNSVTQSPARRPGAPTIAGSTVSDGTIDIGFSVADDGGRSISAIDYSLDNGDSWTTVLAAQSPISVQGLVNGNEYLVQLRARNELGVGAASASTTLVPARAPFAPTVQSIVRGDTTLSVAFRLGANGGDAITDVEYSLDGGQNWLQRPSASTASPLTIGSLTNGTEYTVKLRAVNGQGSGDVSASASGTPIGVPSAPTVSAVTRGDRSASVAFTLGAANGGVISNIEYSIDGGATWSTRSPASTTSPLEISDLTNGSAYSVRIRAVNERGAGPASNATSVTPATRPEAPAISGIGEDGQIKVSFTPAGNGGDAIANLSYSIDDGATWTTRSPASTTGPLVVSGLTNGVTYPVRVKMINSVGEGAASAVANVMPSGPPTAPTITSVTGSDNALSIAFSAGATGGAAITAYDVSSDGGTTWTRQQAVASPLTVTGLVNGSQYSVRIRAVNSRGIGAASNTAQGTPATNPSAPQITEVISADGGVNVNFMYGDTGGAAITNVEYSIDGGDTWVTRSPASTQRPLTITGLANGTTYPVRVRAVNAIGASSASDAANALPATTPGLVTIDAVRSGNGTLTVDFTAPADNGGAAITYYQYSLDGGASWADSPSNTSPIEIAGVTVGTDYTVDLRAVNLRGAGPAATTATAKRVTAPPAPPTITEVESGDGFVSVRYVPPTDTGGTELDRYYFSLDGGENWTQITGSVQSSSISFAASMSLGSMNVFALSGPSAQSLTITGLANGTSYSVSVRGAHVEALGLPSTARSAVPSTTPAAVRNFEVGAQDQRLEVSFDGPLDDGGSTVTGYQYSLDNGSVWFDVAQMPFTVNGLDNGTEYDVMVRATNANGGGTVSTVSATPSTTAGTPVNVSAAAGEQKATIAWDAPLNNGGTPVTDYVIQYSTNNGITWVDVQDSVSTLRTVVVEPLTAGVAYIFRVIPVNAAGRGAPSIPSDAVTPTAPPVPVPDVDTRPVVTPVDQPTTRPVARPVARPVDGGPVIDLLPGSGGIEMEPGEAAAVIEGVVVPVEVSIDAEGTVNIERAGDFTVNVTPRDASGGVVEPENGTVLRVLRGRTIELAGDGFAPRTLVTAWLNSTPIRLGEVTTDEDGAFTATFEVPAGVDVGPHTLTLSGVTAGDESVSTSLGVIVADDSTDDAPDDVDGGSTEAPGDSGGIPMSGIVAGIMAILLLAGVALWLMRRRRTLEG